MKSIKISYLTIIFLFIFKEIKFDIKFDIFINSLSMKTDKSFPQKELSITSDQNFVNWNKENYNREKFYDFIHKSKNPKNINEEEFYQKAAQLSIESSNNVDKFLNSSMLFPEKYPSLENFSINSIDTSILFKQNQTNGLIKEKILFELNEGKFNQLIRKVSLQSSSEKLSNFKLSS